MCFSHVSVARKLGPQLLCVSVGSDAVTEREVSLVIHGGSKVDSTPEVVRV